MTTFLALETSCDETAAAVFTSDLRVLSSVVASQNALHTPFGGVVPEIASRAHVRALTRMRALCRHAWRTDCFSDWVDDPRAAPVPAALQLASRQSPALAAQESAIREGPAAPWATVARVGLADGLALAPRLDGHHGRP